MINGAGDREDPDSNSAVRPDGSQSARAFRGMLRRYRREHVGNCMTDDKGLQICVNKRNTTIYYY